MNKIKRIYVRTYTDSGQVSAYCEWEGGGRTEGTARYMDMPRYPIGPSFGRHMHALFARAKREGLKMQRETW